jgi:hypothetical protein
MVHYAPLSGARDLKNGCLKMAASNSMSPGSGAPATIDDSHASPLGTIRTLHLQMSLRKSTLISMGLPKKLSATQIQELEVPKLGTAVLLLLVFIGLLATFEQNRKLRLRYTITPNCLPQ